MNEIFDQGPEVEYAKIQLTKELTLRTFKDHIDGVRVLFIIARKEVKGNKKMHKRISRNAEEFAQQLEELLIIQRESEIPLRIYSSVNSRDVNKAIRKFKETQLQNDYDNESNKLDFYCDVKNRFLSALMVPSSRSSRNFLIDIDDPAQLDKCKEVLSPLTEILLEYPTKNGFHLVVKPFNVSLLNLPDVTINKDGLMLLAY